MKIGQRPDADSSADRLTLSVQKGWLSGHQRLFVTCCGDQNGTSKAVIALPVKSMTGGGLGVKGRGL